MGKLVSKPGRTFMEQAYVPGVVLHEQDPGRALDCVRMHRQPVVFGRNAVGSVAVPSQ